MAASKSGGAKKPASKGTQKGGKQNPGTQPGKGNLENNNPFKLKGNPDRGGGRGKK